MSAAPVNRDQRSASPGLFDAAVRRVFRLVGWLLLSLVFSIALEWIGLIWWWPDQGAQHSLDMYAAEIAYLTGDYTKSLIARDPAAYAAALTELEYTWLWENTHAIRLVQWIVAPPPADASAVRQGLHTLSEFAIATVNITQVFTIRVAILTLAMPVFILFGLVGLTDGLVQRDIRKWGGGRESGYIFHWATKFVGPAFFLTWLLYLSMPFSINPGLVVLPFALLFALMLRIASTTFKKYL